MKPEQEKIWANLIHLSYNMWTDRVPREIPDGGPWKQHAPNVHLRHYPNKPFLRLNQKLWDQILVRMAEQGLNMVVIDMGDGVRYDSHPEIAVKNAWSVAKMRSELEKMRALGLEPIPKLNFSACHDAWLGPYSRMVSTPTYYRVVRDLIAEMIRIFDRPRLFHIGMDEETFNHQRRFRYALVRQYDLWWHDLHFYVKEIEKRGARAWMWSDYAWEHPDEFTKKMPRSVMQSNWYYHEHFTEKDFANLAKKAGDAEAAKRVRTRLKAFDLLDRAGYDQIPTGSNWIGDTNFAKTVAYCAKAIAPKRLAGFMTACWAVTLPEFRDYHFRAIDQVGAARRAFEKRS